MTAKEQVEMVGRTVWLHADGLMVDVRITDVRAAYGRTDYLVTPIAGTLSVWVSSSRVTVPDEEGTR